MFPTRERPALSSKITLERVELALLKPRHSKFDDVFNSSAQVLVQFIHIDRATGDPGGPIHDK